MAQNGTGSTGKARRRSWSFWLGIIISLGCVIWAVGALEWAAVNEALTSANPLWIGLGVLTVLLTIGIRLARWMALLYPRQSRPSNLMAAMLVGQLLNYFAPARAGDLARAYLLGDAEGESKIWALGTVALEKMWDIWALLALVALLAFLTTLPDWLVAPVKGLAILTLLALIAILLVLRHRPLALATVTWLGHFLPTKVNVRLQHSVERLLDGLDGLRRPRVWFWAVVWSVIVWGMGALTNHTVLVAFGLSLPFTASLMLLAVLQMGVAVPSLPGRVGIFEGLCIITLALFGVEQETAFAVGLVLHAVVFVPPILLGVYYAWRIGGIKP
jgi:uncharacterized protein (TIRG00374 family)